MATVTNNNTGTTKEVLNLGWLLRHATSNGAQMVSSVEVNLMRGPAAPYAAELLVHLKVEDAASNYGACGGGTSMTYRTEFQDKTVLWDFLNRPSLAGVPCIWDGQPERLSSRKRPYPVPCNTVSLSYALQNWPVRTVTA